MVDFHDTGALRRIPLTIDWLDPLKVRPAFFPCLRCLPLVSFLNKLCTNHSLIACVCVLSTAGA